MFRYLVISLLLTVPSLVYADPQWVVMATTQDRSKTYEVQVGSVQALGETVSSSTKAVMVTRESAGPNVEVRRAVITLDTCRSGVGKIDTYQRNLEYKIRSSSVIITDSVIPIVANDQQADGNIAVLMCAALKTTGGL